MFECAVLLRLDLVADQSCVKAALCQELLMRTLLHYRAIFKDNDQIGILDGAQAMGDHYTRTGKGIQIPIHGELGEGIQMTGSLIEQEKRRIAGNSARDGQAL